MNNSSDCYAVGIRVVRPIKCSFRGMWRSEPHQCLRDKAARTLKLCLHECKKENEPKVQQAVKATGSPTPCTCHSWGHATLVKPDKGQPSSRCLGKSVRTKQRGTAQNIFQLPIAKSKIFYCPCWAFLLCACVSPDFLRHMTFVSP